MARFINMTLSRQIEFSIATILNNQFLVKLPCNEEIIYVYNKVPIITMRINIITNNILLVIESRIRLFKY